jgi:hypothetical protein
MRYPDFEQGKTGPVGAGGGPKLSEAFGALGALEPVGCGCVEHPTVFVIVTVDTGQGQNNLRPDNPSPEASTSLKTKAEKIVGTKCPENNIANGFQCTKRICVSKSRIDDGMKIRRIRYDPGNVS